MKKYIVLFFLCFTVTLHADPSCAVMSFHERGIDGEAYERYAEFNRINNANHIAYIRRMRALEQQRRLRAIREYNLMMRRYNNQAYQNNISVMPRRLPAPRITCPLLIKPKPRCLNN